MNDKFKSFFKQYIGYLAVVLISIAYIVMSFLENVKTGKSILEIILDSSIVLAFGLSITRVFDIQGIMNGDNEESVKNAVKNHSNKLLEISPSANRLEVWCALKNAEALKITRIKILARSSLKYDDCFDENGIGKGYNVDMSLKGDKYLWKEEMQKLKRYNQALRAKVTLLNANILTSESGREHDPNYLGRSKQRYETVNSITDVVSKVVVAFIFGYYGVQLVQDFSWMFLVWRLFQVALFLCLGVVKMMMSYQFVTTEFKGRIVNKTIKLTEFGNFVKKNPNITKEEEIYSNYITNRIEETAEQVEETELPPNEDIVANATESEDISQENKQEENL